MARSPSIPNPEFDAIELMRGMTITVTITNIRQLKIRLWLARWLLILAALIANCNIEFEGMDDEKD